MGVEHVRALVREGAVVAGFDLAEGQGPRLVEELGSNRFQVRPFLGMQAVIAAMCYAGGGSIINICSTSGLVAFEDNFAYVASKWAARGMTKATALELAADGVRVNAVCPGETETPMLLSSNGPGAALPPESFPFGRWANRKRSPQLWCSSPQKNPPT